MLNMNPYLTSGYGKLYLHFYLSKDALMSKVEIDLDDFLYDIKEYLKGMYESWNEEGDVALDNVIVKDISLYKDKEKKNITCWGTAGYSFNVSTRIVEAVMKQSKRKRNFYLPLSKKVVYNNVDEVAVNNMAYLEKVAREQHSLQPFLQWFEEYKIYRKDRTKSKKSPRISREQAFKLFCASVSEKK